MTSLLDLGPTLLFEIVLQVPPRDRFQSLSKTCRKLNNVCSGRRSWRGQFFPLHSIRTLNGVSHPTHNHSASLYCPKSDSDKAQMIIFGGNLSHNNVIEKIQNELWCFNFETNSWTSFMDQNIPARTEHSSVVFEDQLYVFGGFGGHYRNDLLSIPLPLTSESKFTEVTASGDIPTPRSAHSMVVYKDHMYIFGGWRGIQSPHSNSDLYKFSFRDKIWTFIPPKGQVPFRRRVHNCVVYNDSMYIFGGFDEGRSPSEFNQVYRFDFQTEEWFELQCKGDIPNGRSRASAVQWGNCMYVLGGWDRLRPFADFYELNLDTLVWREVETNFAQLYSDGIQAHSAVVVGDWLVTFGGKSGGTRMYDQMFSCRLGRNQHPQLTLVPASCNNSVSKLSSA